MTGLSILTQSDNLTWTWHKISGFRFTVNGSTCLSSLSWSCHGSPVGDPPNPFMILKKKAFSSLIITLSLFRFPVLSTTFLFLFVICFLVFFFLYFTNNIITYPISFTFFCSFIFYFLFWSCSSSCLAALPSASHESITINIIHGFIQPWRLHLSLVCCRPSLASPNSLVPPPLTSLTSLSLPHPSHSQLASLSPTH